MALARLMGTVSYSNNGPEARGSRPCSLRRSAQGQTGIIWEHIGLLGGKGSLCSRQAEGYKQEGKQHDEPSGLE